MQLPEYVLSRVFTDLDTYFPECPKYSLSWVFTVKVFIVLGIYCQGIYCLGYLLYTVVVILHCLEFALNVQRNCIIASQNIF